MLGLSLHLILPAVFLILFLMWVLNLLLYRPMLKNMDQRKEIIDGAVRDVEHADQKLKQLQEEYDQALQEAMKDAKNIYNKVHEDALVTEKEILEQAQLKTEKLTEKATTDLEKNFDSAKEDLQSYVEFLSREISVKMMGRAL